MNQYSTIRMTTQDNQGDIHVFFAVLLNGDLHAVYEDKEGEGVWCMGKHRDYIEAYKKLSFKVQTGTYYVLKLYAEQTATEEAEEEERLCKEEQLRRDMEACSFEENNKRMMWVSIFQRDCDNSEWQSFSKIEATEEAYSELYDDIEYWAEGPFNMYPISAQQYKEDSEDPYYRDLGMEAHENGHPHLIVGGIL